MDDATTTELEAAAFRALVDHLRAHPEVQNIDLMNLAGFCRNCLARWYQEAAATRGLDLTQGRGPRDRLRHALRRLGRPSPGRGGSVSRRETSRRNGQPTAHKRRAAAQPNTVPCARLLRCGKVSPYATEGPAER